MKVSTGLFLVAVLLSAAASSGLLLAAEQIVSFETGEQRARYDRMLEEYRCLKCQNQNLAGSNADLAGDLRREIREQILGGADDKAIDHYLVSRYGDFVRYKPRFGGANLVLWLGPFVLLAVGALVGVRMARRSGESVAAEGFATQAPETESLEAARRLLASREPD